MRLATETGSMVALDAVEGILRLSYEQPVAQDYKRKCDELADLLFDNIGSQLTVERHLAKSVDRGAFMDTIDAPLNDADWLLMQCKRIRSMNSEEERLEGILQMLNRTNPGPGGHYDNLGSYRSAHRIDQGQGYAQDPGFLHSPRVAPAVHLRTG